MPSSYSPDLRLELPADGEQTGLWGQTTNRNLGTLIESAIAGATSVSVTTADQALTALNGADDQSRHAMLVLTTTTGANFAVYAPPASKTYIVRNASSYTATIYNSTVLGNTTAAGAGVAVPAGKTLLVFSDGTDFRTIDAAALTGTLAVANGGTGATDASGARTNLGLVIGTNVPSPTGTGASGTWNISILGNATRWATGRTVAMTGDVAYTSPAIDGTANVTAAATIASNAVTTTKIADNNVTDAKISTVSASKLTGDVAADRLTTALNASGSAPLYVCRAWVNFNGAGTVAIRASGNVSSVTDNTTGDYTVNFTTAMPDADYAVSVDVSAAARGWGFLRASTAQSASAVRVGASGASADFDPTQVHVAIFR